MSPLKSPNLRNKTCFPFLSRAARPCSLSPPPLTHIHSSSLLLHTMQTQKSGSACWGYVENNAHLTLPPPHSPSNSPPRPSMGQSLRRAHSRVGLEATDLTVPMRLDWCRVHGIVLGSLHLPALLRTLKNLLKQFKLFLQNGFLL